MKTNAKSIIAFSALLIGFLAFKQSEAAKIRAVKSIVTKGKWKVNLYRDNGVDETNNYTGYEFQFKPNGTVTATKDNNLLNGTWKSALAERKTKLFVDFDSASQLDELSEDWEIMKKTSDSLELGDKTTSHGGVDYLNFQKIA